MKKIILTSTFISVLAAASVSVADTDFQALTSGQATQAIQITNLLANRDAKDPGVTETRVKLSFDACWDQLLNYQDMFDFRAGPGMGCKNKVTKVVITPIATVGKTAAYAPYTVTIDTASKIFITQLIINQDQAPVFDPESGAVKTPGTIKVKSQEQFF